MLRLIRFNTRSALLATFWWSVFLFALTAGDPWDERTAFGQLGRTDFRWILKWWLVSASPVMAIAALRARTAEAIPWVVILAGIVVLLCPAVQG